MNRPAFLTCPAAMWLTGLAFGGWLVIPLRQITGPLLLVAPPVLAGVALSLCHSYGESCDIFPTHRWGCALLFPLGFILAPAFWAPLLFALTGQWAFAAGGSIPLLSIIAFMFLHLREHADAPPHRVVAATLRHISALPIYALLVSLLILAVSFVTSLLLSKS